MLRAEVMYGSLRRTRNYQVDDSVHNFAKQIQSMPPDVQWYIHKLAVPEPILCVMPRNQIFTQESLPILFAKAFWPRYVQGWGLLIDMPELYNPHRSISDEDMLDPLLRGYINELLVDGELILSGLSGLFEEALRLFYFVNQQPNFTFMHTENCIVQVMTISRPENTATSWLQTEQIFSLTVTIQPSIRIHFQVHSFVDEVEESDSPEIGVTHTTVRIYLNQVHLAFHDSVEIDDSDTT